MENLLSSIGLILDIGGVVILFIFANPFRGKSAYWTSDEMVQKDKEEENKLRKWQKFGLFLLGLGFLLQFLNSIGFKIYL